MYKKMFINERFGRVWFNGLLVSVAWVFAFTLVLSFIPGGKIDLRSLFSTTVSLVLMLYTRSHLENIIKIKPGLLLGFKFIPLICSFLLTFMVYKFFEIYHVWSSVPVAIIITDIGFIGLTVILTASLALDFYTLKRK